MSFCKKDILFKIYKIEFLLFFIISQILLSLNGCTKYPSEPFLNNGNNGIYALKETNENLWGELYYSNFDSIDFRKIDGCEHLWDVLIDKKNNLVIGASDEKLFFVDMHTNKKIKEIEIPKIENPEPYFSRTIIALFPCKWNPDIVFLSNWSVYQINIKEMTVEKTLWNATNSDKIIYTNDAKINNDGTVIYLKLTLLGYWIDGEFTRYESRQQLVKLNLINEKLDTVFNFLRKEDGGGAQRILYSYKYVFTYNLQSKTLFRFSNYSNVLVDSFKVSESNYIFSSFSLGDSIIIQDANTGSFYMMQVDPISFEKYIPLNYSLGVNSTTYESIEGGDVYACFEVNSLNKFFIINLTNKKVVKEFQENSIYKIYFFQKGD